MKRIIAICMLVALALTACQKLGDLADYEDIPGVDVGKHQDDGTQYVSYRNVALPESGDGRAEMLALLSLIGDQKGEIDDALFEKSLLESVFVPVDRFMKDTEFNMTWNWAYQLVGVQIFCDLLFAEGGEYYIPAEPGCAFMGDPAHTYMHEQGYHGWYSTEKWSYDADTDTLVTTDSGFELKAKILYFDGERVVMLGHLGGVASIGWRGSNPDFRILYEEELYLYTFEKDRDSFFDGLLSAEEYNAMIEEYRAREE